MLVQRARNGVHTVRAVPKRQRRPALDRQFPRATATTMGLEMTAEGIQEVATHALTLSEVGPARLQCLIDLRSMKFRRAHPPAIGVAIDY